MTQSLRIDGPGRFGHFEMVVNPLPKTQSRAMDSIGIASVEALKAAKKYTPENRGTAFNPDELLVVDVPCAKTYLDALVYDRYHQLVQERGLGYGPFGDVVKMTIRYIPEEEVAFSLSGALGTLVTKIKNLVVSLFWKIASLCGKQRPQVAFTPAVVDEAGSAVRGRLAIQITGICDKAFPKPGLAADLVPLVRVLDKEGHECVCTILIKRLNPPGENQPATMGGFFNVNKSQGEEVEQLATSIKTAISEGKEEAGWCNRLDDRSVYNDPACTHATGTVKVRIGKKEERFRCLFEKVATIRTSDAYLDEGGERIRGRDAKRVSQTDVWAQVVDLRGKATKADLEASIKAGDDATKVFLIDCTEQVRASDSLRGADQAAAALFKELRMGIQHHKDVLARAFHFGNWMMYGEGSRR